MIQQEIIEINEKEFLKTTIKPEFVETHELRKVGTDEIYDEAIDIIESEFQYEVIEKQKDDNS